MGSTSCCAAHLLSSTNSTSIALLTFGVVEDAAACLGWGALHDRTMIFLAFPDYGQNLRKVHLTSQRVEAIRAAIKTVHFAGVLHNDGLAQLCWQQPK